MPRPPHAALAPVPFTAVRFAPGFWHDWQTRNRQTTIPTEFTQCKTSGRLDAWSWTPGTPGEPPHIFWDSDVAKWMEAASYSLATTPDPALDAQLDQIIDAMAKAQAPDGYLNSHFLRVRPDKRWQNLRDEHELYCAGHLIEAAVAHFRATGKRTFLEIICRYVDHIANTFGTGPKQNRGYCGHEEIELALFRLYDVTNDPTHLALATYFLEERGRTPNYFLCEAAARGETKPPWGGPEYYQAHLPIREQTTAEGHAVRAVYLYCGMTDLAAYTGDPALRSALETLWQNVTARRMYVTGGVGSSAHGERFTTDYDLPNASAYAETCAAIGLIFWAQRLNMLTGEARFIDHLERALFNGALSGLSLSGDRFFYVNPLASRGTHHRQEWFGCACCPPNIARLLASLGGYFYATAGDSLTVNLYAAGTADVTIGGAGGGRHIQVIQETRYPWEPTVHLHFSLSAAMTFELRLRIPAWCDGASITINGKPQPFELRNGYAVIRRNWTRNDRIALSLPMPVQRIEAHPAVADDAGRIALQRGPIVYCLESADNGPNLADILIPRDAKFEACHEPSLLGGVTVLQSTARRRDPATFASLYRPQQHLPATPHPIRAIPYYAWDNRTPGEMAVWLRTD